MRHPSAWVLVLAGSLLAARAGGAEGERAPKEAPEPLYVLTYDHGGLVLWGHDHFAAKLREAVQWLERDPGFRIGEEFRARFAHIRPLLATRADDSDLKQEALVREHEGDPGIRWILLEDLASNASGEDAAPPAGGTVRLDVEP
jgi:hypothetical protein